MQDKAVADNAAAALGKIKADPQRCVPALIQALQSGDKETKQNAAEALGEFGPDAKDAVNPLIAAVQSDDQKLRAQAAGALGKIGPDAAPATPVLATIIDDPKVDGAVLQQAVYSLSGLGKSALPPLMQLMKSKDVVVRSIAYEGIQRMKGDAVDAVPTIIQMLQGDDTQAHWEAAGMLAAIGPPAKAAVPTLIKAAQNSSVMERRAESYALYAIDPAAAKAAGIDKPITTYMAWIQQRPEVFKARQRSIMGGPPDGPVVLWINGDPMGFFTGGGRMMSINEWLQPGKNELTVSGAHHAPVFALVDQSVGTDSGNVIDAGAFPEPGGKEQAAAMTFSADQAPRIPERDALANIPHEVLQKEVEQQLKEFVELVKAHKGANAAELLYAGERLWSKPAAGENDKEIGEEIDDAAKGLAHPQTTIELTDRPIQLLVGQHALLAYVEMPQQGKEPARLFKLKNGKNEMGSPFLLFARVHGRLIIWEAPRGVSISLSDHP